MSKLFLTLKKPHINIGTLGHVDHGKTTLTAALTTFLSHQGSTIKKNYAEIDSTPDEQIRGITINATHIEYETNSRHFAHIDCPGHSDFIKNMITGAVQLEAAILVVSCVEGLMPQTREHVLVAYQLGISSLIVFLNKLDLIEDLELIDIVEIELRELFSQYPFKYIYPHFIRGSALKALSLYNKIYIKESQYNTDTGIMKLVDVLDNQLPLPQRDILTDYVMPIEDIFSITGRGTVITGKIDSGIVQIGDSIKIIGFNKVFITMVLSIEMFNKTLSKGCAGDNIGILVKGIIKTHINRGMFVVSNKSSITQHDSFEANIYLLTDIEGGRHKPIYSGFCPQFYIRTANITGVIKILNKSNIKSNCSILLPGDNSTVEIKLLNKIPLQLKTSFVFRESGKTIGIGIITKLL